MVTISAVTGPGHGHVFEATRPVRTSGPQRQLPPDEHHSHLDSASNRQRRNERPDLYRLSCGKILDRSRRRKEKRPVIVEESPAFI